MKKGIKAALLCALCLMAICLAACTDSIKLDIRARVIDPTQSSPSASAPTGDQTTALPGGTTADPASPPETPSNASGSLDVSTTPDETVPTVPTTPTEVSTTAEPTPTPPTPTVNTDDTTPVHEHRFGAWTTDVEASCLTAGERSRVCGICGETEREVIPAKGHTVVESADVAPTCTEKGSRGGKRCSVCGAVIEEGTEVPALGHKFVKDPEIRPTCEENGQTGGSHCVLCGEVYEEPTVLKARGHQITGKANRLPTSTRAGQISGGYCTVCGKTFGETTELPAKGTDWILADGEYKLLLIGNSFSQDASNFRAEKEGNQLLNVLKALLGDKVKITIGLCQSGSKTMAWHATSAQNNKRGYSFHILTGDQPTWQSALKRDVSSAEALSYTNWDIVSLQPYHYEAVDGMDTVGEYASEIDEKFYPLNVSLPYMLDHVEKYAPQCDVYCYMPWISSSDAELNVRLSTYNKSAGYFPTVLTMSGTTSGKVFEDLIPVALAVQNARTTYFSLLRYHVGTNTQNFESDSQLGLMRDGLHLTFNIGRYIASLTFAQTVVPQSVRQKNYTLPAIRITESLGKLPDAYTELAQKCVSAALESWKKGSLAVTKMTGYEQDPTVAAAASLAEKALAVDTAGGEDELIALLKSKAAELLTKDFIVESVRLPGGFPADGAKSFSVEITIRFGYTTKTVTVQARMS